MAVMTSAVTQLGEYCEMTYGVPRLQTRILVSTFLPTRYTPLWIMVDSEKCRFLEDLEYALLRLEHSAILDTLFLRGQRAHLANRWIMIVLNAREKPQLFANRYWQWPGPKITPRSKYPHVAAECLRMKLEFEPAKLPGELAREELFALVRRTLEEAPVDRGGVVPWHLEEVFSRRAILIPMIDPFLTNATVMMRNFGFVSANHAGISGRVEPNEEDLQVQRYMLRQAVPTWAVPLLKDFLKRGGRPAPWQDIIHATGQEYEWQWHYGGVNVTRPPKVGDRIIRDFWNSGLVDRNRHHRYSLNPQYADDLEHILEARR